MEALCYRDDERTSAPTLPCPPCPALPCSPSVSHSPKTRHTCASALCKVALRLPDPVRFDAYCFLKGLADAADVFPLIKPHGRTGMGSSAGVGQADDSALVGYLREQEELVDRIEAGEIVADRHDEIIGV